VTGKGDFATKTRQAMRTPQNAAREIGLFFQKPSLKYAT
jgi:hypothetical protein